MMFCADYGSIMYQCRAINFRRDQEYYLCSGYRKSRDVCGQTHSIRTVILEELVLQNLREIDSFASQRKDDYVKMVMDADMRQRNRGLAKRKKTLADAEKENYADTTRRIDPQKKGFLLPLWVGFYTLFLGQAPFRNRPHFLSTILYAGDTV